MTVHGYECMNVCLALWATDLQNVCHMHRYTGSRNMQVWKNNFILNLVPHSSSESACVKVVLVALSWQSKTRLTNRLPFLPCSGCSQEAMSEMAHWHTWYKKHHGITRVLLWVFLVWLECCEWVCVGERDRTGLWWGWHLQESCLEGWSSEDLFSAVQPREQKGSWARGSTQVGQKVRGEMSGQDCSILPLGKWRHRLSTVNCL